MPSQSVTQIIALDINALLETKYQRVLAHDQWRVFPRHQNEWQSNTNYELGLND